MGRILYISHDVAEPAGGVRVLYRHVELLRSAGFDAYVVHRVAGLRIDWFGSTAPVLIASGSFAVSTDDWIVIPEDHRDALQAFSRFSGNKVLFCQNHWFIFNGIAPEQSWSQFGIRDVLVSSNPIRDFVRKVMRSESTLVPLSIDRDIFHPPAQRSGQIQVAVMPRKGAHHMALIRGTVLHLAPELRDVPWIEIQGCDERQVADILCRSTFFVSTGYREGFGLPPLEAMACGALVVGFAGGGGVEYATAENGFWVADEDAIGLAQTLANLLRAYRIDGEDRRWTRVREAGYAAAANYSRQREADALVEFWSQRVMRSAFAAGAAAQVGS